MSENTIEIEMNVDLKEFEKDLEKSKIYARDTGVELDKELKLEMQVDIDDIQQKIKKAKSYLKELDEDSEEARELRINIEDYKSNLTEAKRELRNYVNTGDKEMSRLGALFNTVTDEMKQSRDELVKLGKSTKVLDIFDKKMSDLGKELKDNKIDIKQYREEVGKLGEELKTTGYDFNTLVGKVGKFTKALGPITIAGGSVAGAFAFVNDLNSAFIKLEGQTGKTGKELEKLKDILVAVDNTGFLSIEEGTNLVSKLSKETNLTNQELKDTAIGIAAISKTFEKDYNETLRASTALIKNFGLTGKESNDVLTSTLQKTGDSYDDVLDSINEYSSKMADAGVEHGRFINILVAGTQKGLRNTDELADAQREFAIRVVDGSKKSKEAIEKLGYSYDDLMNEIDSGEITVGDAMQKIAKSIQGVENQTERNILATDLLGTKYEDNGKIMLDVMADVESSLGDVNGATDKLVETNEKGLNKMTKGWNTMTGSVKRFILPFLSDIAGAFGSLFIGIGTGIDKVRLTFILLRNSIGTVFLGLIDIVGNSLGYIQDNFGVLTKNIGIAFDNIPGLAKKGLNGLLKDVSDTINKASSYLNKIPGIEIGEVTFAGFDTTGIRELEKFKDFGDFTHTKKGLKEVGESYNKLIGNITDTNKEVEKGTDNIGKNTTTLKDNTDTSVKGSKTKVKAEKELSKEKEAQNKQDLLYKKYLEKREADKQKAYKKTYDTVKKTYESAGKIIDTTINKSKKSIENFDSEIDKLKESIKGLDDEWKSLDSELGVGLAERDIEILERQKEITQEIKDINSETLNNESLEDRLKLEKELKELTAERVTISENTTQAELDEALRVSKLSYSEKLIEEAEARKADILSQKKEKENQIKDLQAQKVKEGAILTKFTKAKNELDKRYALLSGKIEEKITDKVIEENKKRLAELDKFKKASEDLETNIRSETVNNEEIVKKETTENDVINKEETTRSIKTIVETPDLSEAEKVAVKYYENVTETAIENKETIDTLNIEQQELKQELYDTDVEAKKTMLNIILEETTKELEQEKVLFTNLMQVKTTMQLGYTSFIKTQTNERIAEMERMLEAGISIANKLNALGFSGAGFVATFQKQNEDGSTTTKTETINYGDVTITNNNSVKSDVDMYKIGKETVKQFQRSQQGQSNKTLSSNN